MKVSFSKSITFGRLLKDEENKEYYETLKEAKKKLGQTGKSILIMPDTSLPQNAENNTGVGNLASKEANDFFDFIKLYLGINTVEILPHGNLMRARDGMYNVYSGSSLSISDSRIDLRLLATDDFENILDKKDIDEAVRANNFPMKNKIINYENVLLPDSKVQQKLKKAFENFEKLDNNSKLKKEFLLYKEQTKNRIFPQAVFEILRNKYGTYYFYNWDNETDKNLYNPDYNKELREKRLEELSSDANNRELIDFYTFKQFLAEKHLEIGKKMLNAKGIKLFGDALVGFSYDEVWANPKAFIRGGYIGNPNWQLPALNFEEIKDENSPASKMLKKKFEFYAKKYDGMRVDAAWSYTSAPVYYSKDSNKCQRFNFGDILLNRIENWVKDVKGNDFDKKDIIYEFEAAGKDFKTFLGKYRPVINPVLKNRIAVYNSVHMSNNWGYYSAFIKKGFKKGDICIGVGNHDSHPLRQIANNLPNILSNGSAHYYKNNQLKILGKILKLDPKKLIIPQEFVKAKFAEPMLAKNNHVFFMDVFGREEKFDNMQPRTWLVYRPKLSETYKEDYKNALKSGYGLNIMDAIAKAFKAKGLDKNEEFLYKKVKKFRDILYE